MHSSKFRITISDVEIPVFVIFVYKSVEKRMMTRNRSASRTSSMTMTNQDPLYVNKYCPINIVFPGLRALASTEKLMSSYLEEAS